MTTKLPAEIEIDHDRGVIYIHVVEGPLAGSTILRICNLPTPIPSDRQLDITHMVNCDWSGEQKMNKYINRH